MNREQILKKAIEKAIKNGWQKENKMYWMGQVAILLEDDCRQYYNVIFSHDFAKAFWGKKFDYFNNYDKDGVLLGELLWQYHLQQMVLEKDPIKYLEQFL